IVTRALRKDPGQRWQSMMDVHSRLAGLRQRYESGVLPAVRSRRPRWWFVGAAASITALAAGGWGTTSQRPKPPQPPPTVPPKVEAPAPTAAFPAPAPAPAVAKRQEPVAPAKPTPKAEYILTNKGVIEMAEAKVPASMMISQIRASKTKFDFSVPEIIKLAKAGVPEEVVDVMRDPTAPPKAVPAPPPGAFQDPQ